MDDRSWLEAKVTDPGDIEGAYAFCQQLARNHFQSFPVGTRLVTKSLRRHVAVLYAFARIADELADAEGSEDAREEALADWRAQLRDVGEEPARHPVFLALEDSMREHDLPKQPFDDLLGAHLQDCRKSRYETFDELRDYCRLWANPIGRIVLMVHGYRDEERLRLSDDICTALRLTHILKNMERDLVRDRIYLPLEDFRRFGYTEADLRMKVVNERFRNLMKHQWKRIRQLYEDGERLPKKLHWPLSWEVRLTWLGGNELLRKVHKLGYDTLRRRPRLSRWDWPRLMAGVLFS